MTSSTVCQIVLNLTKHKQVVIIKTRKKKLYVDSIFRLKKIRQLKVKKVRVFTLSITESHIILLKDIRDGNRGKNMKLTSV